MLLTLCGVLGLMVLGCSRAADEGGPAPAPPEGPQRVTLRVGEEARPGGTDIRIKLLSVDDDSRCPQGVNCIWAGNVGVTLLVSAPGDEGERLKLNTAVEPQAVSYKGHSLRIESVSPPRVEGKKINPEDYRLTLGVCADKPRGPAAGGGDPADPARAR